MSAPINAAATITERAERTARVRRAATRAATHYVATGQLVFAAAFWALFALVAVVVPLIVHGAGGELDGGVLHATGYSARWVAFSIGVGTCLNLCAVHLSAGGTRRSLFRGIVAGSVVAGAAYGVLYGLALVGERALFTGLGWTWTAPEGYATGLLDAGVAAGPGNPALGAVVLLGALGEGIAITGYALAGAAVAAVFVGLRHLGRIVAAILVALLTVAAAETVTRTGTGGQTLGAWVAEHWLPGGAAGVALGVLAALLVLGGAIAWLWSRLRRLQLRPPT